MDKRAAIVLGVIFGGLFLVLFGFMLLAYSALKSASTGVSLETETTVGARIGIVEAKGTIGEAAPAGIDADKIVKLLKKYERDDDIKAIVLRVDSPGGAVAPSQEIHDAIKRIKARKKVVVSMGGMAASGGYYISAPADRIFAEPGTLTGSIGVIFLHFNVRGLLEWAKVEETTLKSGKYKDTLSPFRPIQETDREEIQSISDDVYSQFVQAVAQGRGMPEARVREIAEGRIYTGKRAKELKLVDELGGFDDAVAAAWGLAGQSGEPKVQYPPRERELSLRDLVLELISKGERQTGCIFCELPRAGDDRENLILGRSAHTFAILNRFPYNNGHLMVVPRAHIAELTALPREEHDELSEMLRVAVRLVGEAYGAQGYNIGMNLGRTAGAGIVDHLHWHVVPRWNGDTNFMPVLGDTKVMIEHLHASWDRLRPSFDREYSEGTKW